MSKVLEASCIGEVVTCEGVPVPNAEILSEGEGASSGFLVIDGDKAYYVAKTSPNLKTTLEKLISVLSNLTTALTTLDGKPTGTLAPAPAIAVQIASLVTIQTELTTLKETLK